MHPMFKRRNLKLRIMEMIANDRRRSEGRETNLGEKAGEVGTGRVAKVYHLHTKRISCIFADLRQKT